MYVKTRAVVTALEAWRPGPSLALQAPPPVAECLVQIPEGLLQGNVAHSCQPGPLRGALGLSDAELHGIVATDPLPPLPCLLP